jgi:hypothetical protein
VSGICVAAPVQEIERLPEKDRHVIKTLLDAFLTKKQRQTLVR